jgi:hypothetical protein
MTKTMVMGKYPISELNISKNETTLTNVDEIISHLKAKIDAHSVAIFITIFDHYTHTKSLGENGMISEDILDAKNLICCFGKALPEANMVAVRPRSIGVVEMKNEFVLSFLDAPNPQAHETMISWVESVKNK